MDEFSSLTNLHFGALELDKQIGDNNYNGVSYYTCKCGCKIVLTRTQTKKYNFLLISFGLSYEYLYLDKALVCGHTQKDLDNIVRLTVRGKEFKHLSNKYNRN